MGLLQEVRRFFETRRLQRLEADIRMLNERFAFNPYKVALPSPFTDKVAYSRKLIENYVWYSANAKAIQEYYQNLPENVVEDTSFFWATAPDTIRRIHTGLPALISDKMATVLFGAGYKLDVSQMINGLADEKLSSLVKGALEWLMTKQGINLSEKLESSAIKESWSGDIAWKLSFDPTLSKFPILEVVDRRSFEVIKQRGIETAIVFKYYHDKQVGQKVVHFIHHETYNTDKEGTAIVVNELFELLPSGELKLVPLTYLEQTKALAELPYVLDDEGRSVFTFVGLKGLLAFHKRNRIGSHEDDGNPYGVSDYNGNYANFDALDEVVSAIVGEIRDNKTIRYIPDTYFQRSSVDGSLLRLDKYVTNYIKVHADADQNASNKIEFSEFSDKTPMHMEKYKTMISLACNNAGLSPLTLGITGLESIASSDKSTRERAKATLETRKRKHELWKPFLQQALLKTFELYQWMMANGFSPAYEGLPLVNEEATELFITFNDYLEQGIDDRLRTWDSVQNVSIEAKVDQIWGDNLSEEQKMLEVNRIKFEKNMSLDNPELLQLDVPMTPQEEDREVR